MFRIFRLFIYFILLLSYVKVSILLCIFQEYEEACLFTKHESLQGDSPRVHPNILRGALTPHRNNAILGLLQTLITPLFLDRF